MSPREGLVLLDSALVHDRRPPVAAQTSFAAPAYLHPGLAELAGVCTRSITFGLLRGTEAGWHGSPMMSAMQAYAPRFW